MSEEKILESIEGVVLRELNSPQPGGLVAVAYEVSSARTDEVWRSDDADKAKADFDAEVHRSREANNSRANE